MGAEIELKFRIRAEDADALAERLGTTRVQKLEAIYFDTADRRLGSAGWSVRIRDEAGRRRLTAKGPREGLLARAEFDQDVETSIPELDAPALAPLRNMLGDAVLAPIFAVRVTRRTADLDRDGATMEVAVDVGRIEAGERSTPLQELELELKAGGPRALFVLARELQAHAALEVAFESKAEQGFRISDGKAPSAALEPLRKGVATAETFRTAARGCLVDVQAGAWAFISGQRPDDLHGTRVALRRLRSLISAFRPMLGDAQSTAVASELKTLAGRLNAARDLDVFTETVFRPAALEATPEARLGLSELGAALEHRRDQAYAAAVAALDGPERRALILTVVEWLELGDWTRDESRRAVRERSARAFARETLDKLRRRLKRRGAGLSRLSAAERHEARIAAKKLRYAAEAFAPVFPKRGADRKRFFKRLKALQTVLGELNDRAVAQDLAARLAEGMGLQAVAAAGRLTQAGAEGTPMELTAAERAFRDLLDLEPFWRR